MENVAPQTLRHASRQRKPFGNLSRQEGKLALHDSNHKGTQGKRRALGDITNRAGEKSNDIALPNVKPNSTVSLKLDGKSAIRDKAILNTSTGKFKIPTDIFGDVLHPEIIPAPIPELPYTPVLFEDGELENARQKLKEQAAMEDDDTFDFMGRPYVRTELKFQKEVEMPYDPVEMMNDTNERDLLDFTNLDLFNPDQLIPNDEYSTLELV
ncbi:unnamed protein product [Agarophyton chilense]